MSGSCGSQRVWIAVGQPGTAATQVEAGHTAVPGPLSVINRPASIIIRAFMTAKARS